MIAAWARTRTAGEVVALLRERQIPVSRINSIADIAVDPQVLAREMIVAVDDDRLDRPLLVPGIAPKLSRTPGRVPALARPLGADTEAVRAQFGDAGVAAQRPGTFDRGQARRGRNTSARLSPGGRRPDVPGPGGRGRSRADAHPRARLRPQSRVGGRRSRVTFDPDEASERAIRDLTALSTSGIRTVVDLTVPGLGRAIRSSRRSPTSPAAPGGRHRLLHGGRAAALFPVPWPRPSDRQPDPLVAMFVRDIEEGIAGTPVRAGMIKVMTGPAGWTPDVVRVMSAAATAHATDRRHDHDPLRARRRATAWSSRRSSEGTASPRNGSSSGTPATPRTSTTFASSWTTARRSGWTASAWSTCCRMTGGSPPSSGLLALGYADRMVLSHDAAIDSHVTPPAWRAREAPNWHMANISHRILPMLRAGRRSRPTWSRCSSPEPCRPPDSSRVTVKAALLVEPGRIVVDDVPSPTPGPDEVRIAVGGVGLCGSDLSVFRGAWTPPTYPWIMGHEAFGTIEAVGQGGAHDAARRDRRHRTEHRLRHVRTMPSGTDVSVHATPVSGHEPSRVARRAGRRPDAARVASLHRPLPRTSSASSR